MSGETIREALQQVEKVFVETPEKARSKDAATASLRDGLAFEVTGTRGQVLQTDMPKGVGVSASGPTRGCWLWTSVAYCTGWVIRRHDASLGVNVDKLEVTVEAESDTRGMLGLDETIAPGFPGFRTLVRIAAANASAEQLREIVQ